MQADDVGPSKRAKGKVAEQITDDAFGEDDDDWHVYRKIVRESQYKNTCLISWQARNDEDDETLEQEELRLNEIEELLLKHDPQQQKQLVCTR